MEEVRAPDDRTLVIRWKQPYGDAVDLGPDFQALPRHVLQDDFAQQDPVAFSGNSFWTVDYLGLGPYRLTHWEPGAFIDATAFDGYVLGKPKIDRIQLRFIRDTNTALASLLSGDVQYVGDFVFSDTEAKTLEQRWGSDHGGEVLYGPTEFRMTSAQLRPDYAVPKGILDVRVRKAIAYSIDAETMVQVLTGGKGLLTYTMSSPAQSYYPEIDRVIEKHAYDPQRTAQLMADAGFTKASDGFFADREGQFTPTVWSSSGPKNEQENQVLVDSLKRSGINASSAVIPAAQVRDAQARALLTALQIRGFGARRIELQISEEIPKPENRWTGENRGAWSSPEYDRLFEEYTLSLDHNERIQKIAQMERIFSEDVPGIPLYFGAVITAHTADLKGPTARQVPEAQVGWYNLQNWDWR
jgi:peptide/nickel transport system substrate-binding protein